MGQVADGASSATAPSSDLDAGDSIAEPHSRGFIGRILGALGASSLADNDTDEPVPAAQAAPVVALPGLSNLRNMRVGDVAIPKVEIIAVSGAITRDELVEVFRNEGYSRLPVFKGTLDTPLGLVHLKDLALEYGFGNTASGRFSV
ncbi:MAG TPA: magnesium/cobalt efflux protein, partial [Paenirhodobacter sp.]